MGKEARESYGSEKKEKPHPLRGAVPMENAFSDAPATHADA